MRKLALEELQNMTLDDAWNITQEFSGFLAEGGAPALYEFEDVLPYQKNDILFAIIHLLQYLKKEDIVTGTLEEIKENLSTLAVSLEGFIPSEETYKEMLNKKSYLNENLGQKIQEIRDEIKNENRENKI